MDLQRVVEFISAAGLAFIAFAVAVVIRGIVLKRYKLYSDAHSRFEAQQRRVETALKKERDRE